MNVPLIFRYHFLKLSLDLDLVKIPNLTLTYVNIYFDSVTMEEITYSMKTNFEMKLSTIGGTMGLFTGFSLLTTVEIVYHLGKSTYRLFKRRLMKGTYKSSTTDMETTL